MVYKTSQGMPCWTEIPARDVPKIFNFYKAAFPGWDFPSGDPKVGADGRYETTIVNFCPKLDPSISGGIVHMPEDNIKANENASQPMGVGTTTYFYVNSIDEEMTRLEKLGAKLVLPKRAESDNGWFCNFLDPEGNRFGLYQLNTEKVPSEAVDA